MAIWSVGAEQEEEWAKQNKTRHAMMPVEVFQKPVFDRQALPKSVATTLPRRDVSDFERKVKTYANPNKKAWKNTIEQVKVAGGGLIMNFKEI